MLAASGGRKLRVLRSGTYDMASGLYAWLRDPLVSRFLALLVALIGFMLVGRWLRNLLVSRIDGTESRYRTRKSMNIALWAVAVVVSMSVFSDWLGGLAVSFGVAGAGIAFALQEVIASVAGRVAVLFGGFYSVGDRVQLGGIKGDVVDIGTLRTTIMEIGDWVNGDLYTGRVVRVANSFVLDAVDASGGSVALASATFQLVATPTFDVRMVGGEAPAPAGSKADARS
jgi:small-conductance mechanosensitive channel